MPQAKAEVPAQHFRMAVLGSYLQISAVTGLLLHTCVGELCRGLAQEKRERELVTSQAACQGILVGVCIELSQFKSFLLDAILATGTQMKLAPSPRLLFSPAPASQPSPAIASCQDLADDKGVFSSGGVGAMSAMLVAAFIFRPPSVAFFSPHHLLQSSSM